MDMIDQALNNLPFDLVRIVFSFLGNPHGFTRLDADAKHKCLKYHHGHSWFSGPDANKHYDQYIIGCIQQFDQIVEGVDEVGNSKLRTMILQQWADPNHSYVCGLHKRWMVVNIEETFFWRLVDKSSTEVRPSGGEYFVNKITKANMRTEKLVFKSLEGS